MGFIKDAFHNFKRKPSLFLIGFLSIFFTQLLVNIFIFGYLEVEKMGNVSGGSFTIKAYFKTGKIPRDAQQVIGEIKKIPEVKSVVFVSREDARKKFADYFNLQGDDLPLEENPFPESIEIIPNRVEAIPDLADRLRRSGYFEEVLYGGKNVEVFVRFYRMLLSVGGSVLFLIFLFSLIVIVNLIRISIQSRKEEIHVISLMGATERFIRLPILAEGFFEGFFAGLSAFILSLVVFRFLLEFLQVTFPFFFWISLKEAVIPFMVVNIVLGGMVGVLGSLIACNSILKEILK